MEGCERDEVLRALTHEAKKVSEPHDLRIKGRELLNGSLDGEGYPQVVYAPTGVVMRFLVRGDDPIHVPVDDSWMDKEP